MIELIRQEVNFYEQTNKLNKGVIAYIVYGECEGQSLEEKILVALTIINREMQHQISFNDMKIDYHGWNRKFKIQTSAQRQAYVDAVKAFHIAKMIYEKYPSFHNIFFFNNHGGRPSTSYYLEKVETPGMAHTFFKIV